MKQGADGFLPIDYQSPECPILAHFENEEKTSQADFKPLSVRMTEFMWTELKRTADRLRCKDSEITNTSSLVRRACAEFLSAVTDHLSEERFHRWVREQDTGRSFLPSGYQEPGNQMRLRLHRAERDATHIQRVSQTLRMSSDMIRLLRSVSTELRNLGDQYADVDSLVRMACANLLEEFSDK